MNLVSQDQRSGLVSDATSLDHDVVVVDDTVVRESSHWGDVLLSQVGLSGGVVVDSLGGGLSYSGQTIQLESYRFCRSSFLARFCGGIPSDQLWQQSI